MVLGEDSRKGKREWSVTRIDVLFLSCLALVSVWKMIVAADFETFYGLLYLGTVDILVEAAKILKYSNSFPVGGTTTFFLLPYTMTLLLKLGIAGKAPLYLCVFSNLACGFFTYLLADEMYGKKVGFISGLLVLSNWHFWWWSSVLLADAPNVLLMTVSVYLFYRGTRRGSKLSLWYSAVLLAFAVLTKYSSVVLVILFIVDRLVNYRSWLERSFMETLAAFLFFVATMMCWGFYNLQLERGFFDPLVENVGMNAPTEIGLQSSLIAGLSRLRYHLVDKGFPLVFSIPCMVLSIFGFAYALARRRNGKDREYFLLAWILIFLFAFSFRVGYAYERYALHWTVPMLIGSSLGIVRFEEKTPKGMKILAYALAAFCILSTNNAYPLPFLDVYPSIKLRSLTLAHERILRYAHDPEDRAYRQSYEILRIYARAQGFNCSDFLLMSSILLPAVYYACKMSYSRFVHYSTPTIERNTSQAS